MKANADKKRWNKAQMWVVVILTALVFAMRVSSATVAAVWYDEAFTVHYARELAEGGAEAYRALMDILGLDVNPPLHYYLFAGWIALAGEEDFVLRLFSILISLLTIPLLVKTGEELARRTSSPIFRRSGYYAALFYATLPLFVHYGREVRWVSAAVTASALTLLSGMKLIAYIAEGQKTKQMAEKWSLIYAVSSITGGLLHVSGLLMAASLAVGGALAMVLCLGRRAFGETSRGFGLSPRALLQRLSSAPLFRWIYVHVIIAALYFPVIVWEMWRGQEEASAPDSVDLLHLLKGIPVQMSDWGYLAVQEGKLHDLGVGLEVGGAGIALIGLFVLAVYNLRLKAWTKSIDEKTKKNADERALIPYLATSATITLTPVFAFIVSIFLFVALVVTTGKGSPRYYLSSLGLLWVFAFGVGVAAFEALEKPALKGLLQRKRVKGLGIVVPSLVALFIVLFFFEALTAQSVHVQVLQGNDAGISEERRHVYESWMLTPYPDIRDVTTYILENRQEGDAVLVVAGPAHLVVEHYIKVLGGEDEALDVYGLPERNIFDFRHPVDLRSLVQLQVIASSHRRVWLVLWWDDHADPERLVLNAMLDNYPRLGVGAEFPYTSLLLFQTDEDGELKIARASLPQRPTVILWDEADEGGVASATPFILRGYSLDCAPAGESTGSVVSVRLYWELRGGTASDYTAFAHLFNAPVVSADTLIAQADEKLGNDLIPTSKWATGTYIPTTHLLPVDVSCDALKDGGYMLTVGLYDSHSLQRLHPWDESIEAMRETGGGEGNNSTDNRPAADYTNGIVSLDVSCGLRQ